MPIVKNAEPGILKTENVPCRRVTELTSSNKSLLRENVVKTVTLSLQGFICKFEQRKSYSGV